MAITGKTITDLADDLETKGSAKAHKLGAKASDVIVEMKDEVAAMAGKAGSGAKSAASSGKDMASDALHGLADAARKMAGKIDDGTADGNAKVAEFARKAADSMERFSSGLRDKDVEEIAANARDTIRQNPAIAVGAAALIGFALARFMKGGSGRD